MVHGLNRLARMGLCLSTLIAWCGLAFPGTGGAQETLPHVIERFQEPTSEVPDFQKHVVPLFGRLGCNGRACHGSFQGQGGFQLSLFGYDFNADHQALFADESPRVDVDSPLQSLILAKPTDEDEHEGGKRFDREGWEHQLLAQWIEAGAPATEPLHRLERLEVHPSEIQLTAAGETVQLLVTAVWEDGSREDVTPLCRFRSNDEQLALIDEDGQVTGGDAGATHVVVFYDKAVVPIPVQRPVSEFVGDHFPAVPTPTPIDELVVQKLRKLGVVPSELADDATFLRRLRLDLTGTLPTPDEVTTFLVDEREDKRARKIDELLESPAYAAWWTTKLCDFTGNNSEQLNNTLPIPNQAAQDWYDWIYKRVSDNTPYDELVAGIVTAKSLEPGQSYGEFSEQLCSIYRGEADTQYADLPSMTHYWTRRDLRDPESRAINFAYAFMGVRIQCAQCHKHPFDQWSKQDFDEFTKFFGTVVFDQTGRQMHGEEYQSLLDDLGVEGGQRGNQLRREFGKLMKEGKTVPMPVVAVRPGAVRPRNRRQGRQVEPPVRTLTILGTQEVPVEGVADVREPLMEWLRSDDNPYFARAFVNRVWAAYFGVGIVEPADDLNLANPPSNAPLLEYLERGFVESRFDMKWLHREIANSRTYQLDWRPNETNQLDHRHFARAYLKRMPAEVVCDAMLQATVSSQDLDRFQSDLNQRTIAIAGTQLPVNLRTRQFALEVFGRSTRESNCDCDRSEEASLLQTVYLQNDQDIYQVLKRPGGWLNEVAGVQPARTPEDSVPAARQTAAIRNRLRQVSRQIERAKAENREDLLERLKRQQTNLRRRLGQLEPDQEGVENEPMPKAESPRESMTSEETDRLISEAYLRTLSRFPDPSERTRCQAYFQDADSLATGLEGLMWALINTKEFRVIH